MTGVEQSCLEFAETLCVCEEGPAAECDALGAPYMIVVSGGQCKEGERLPALYRDPLRAAGEWFEALAQADYAFRVKHEPQLHHDLATPLRLFWRVKPEINEIVRYRGVVPVEGGTDRQHYDLVDVEKWYTVYARLSFAAPAGVHD